MDNHVERIDALELIANAVIADNARRAIFNNDNHEDRVLDQDSPAYLQVMEFIEQEG